MTHKYKGNKKFGRLGALIKATFHSNATRHTPLVNWIYVHTKRFARGQQRVADRDACLC